MIFLMRERGSRWFLKSLTYSISWIGPEHLQLLLLLLKEMLRWVPNH